MEKDELAKKFIHFFFIFILENNKIKTTHCNIKPSP